MYVIINELTNSTKREKQKTAACDPLGGASVSSQHSYPSASPQNPPYSPFRKGGNPTQVLPLVKGRQRGFYMAHVPSFLGVGLTLPARKRVKPDVAYGIRQTGRKENSHARIRVALLRVSV